MSGPDLMIQRCGTCGHHLFPPRLGCSRCGGADLRAVPAGPGTVVDVVEIVRSPDGRGDGTAVVALIALAAGPRVIASATPEARRGVPVTLVDDGGVIRVTEPRRRQ